MVISSPVSGEGKTFVSVNLATIISMMNKKVLIVGLDLRKPRVHAILKAGNGQGMSQYLSGSATFDEVIVPTEIDNLWFAPSGPVPPNPAELIGSPRMAEFLAQARNEFDTVIIPNFHKYNEICGSFNVEWQDYYVAATRARSNLYLISHYDMPQLKSVTDKSYI